MIKSIVDKVLPREIVIKLVDLKRRIFLGSQSKKIYAKWAEHETIKDWLGRGWLDDQEFRLLAFEWEKYGGPVPPPHQVKERLVAKYGKENNIPTMIETGTYLGDMLYALRDDYSKIISVELSKELWKRAQIRFKDFDHISIVNGDSGTELKNVLKNIEGPVVFWLDGHYSGGITAKGELDCPIYGELDAVFQSGNNDHVILIDDARLFNGTNDYPTMNELETYSKEHWPNCQISTESDIICIHK